MDPPPSVAILLATDCDNFITARTLIRNVRSKSSMSVSRNGDVIAIPAQFTRPYSGRAALANRPVKVRNCSSQPSVTELVDLICVRQIRNDRRNTGQVPRQVVQAAFRRRSRDHDCAFRHQALANGPPQST